MWIFVQLPVTLTPCRDDHWSSACIMQIWMKTDGVPLAHVHPHVTLIPCRGRLWRSVVSDRIYWIMRAAKGSPYRGSIIVFGHHGRSESAPTYCLTIYVRLSADGQWPSLQCSIHIYRGYYGRTECAPTHCLTIYVRLSADDQWSSLQYQGYGQLYKSPHSDTSPTGDTIITH